MKKVIRIAAALSLAVPLMSASMVSAAPAPAVHDYNKEIQVNQFRPHGGDHSEVQGFFAEFVKNIANPKEVEKLLAADSQTRAAVQEYLAGLSQYKEVKVVEAKVEKLFTVADYDAFTNYRAIAKFKYLGYTKDNKIIEKTDYIGMAKLGKEATDWKLWGLVWQDTGIDVSDVKLFQLEKPAKGEEICVITTDAGVIKLRLFPDKAPKAVQNFKELSQKGFYNERLFHRVINDFMIQIGGKEETPEENETIFGGAFEDEFNRDLFHFRGAISMGNEGPNSNTNHFFIVQSPKVDQQYLDLSALPLNAEAKYQEIGGRAYLDNRHTVFGQVFEGMEAVDKIAAQETDENGLPLKDAMRILKIEFVKYE